MITSHENKIKAIISYIFIIIAAVDVLTQYTPLHVIGLWLHFVMIAFYGLALPFLLRIRFKRSDILFLILCALSLALNFNNYSFSNYEYLRVSFYTLIFLFSYLLLMRLKETVVSVRIIKFLLFISAANIIVRFALNKAGIVIEWNYNWSAILFLVPIIILYRDNNKLIWIGFISSFIVFYIGSRGSFLAVFMFSIVLLFGKMGMLPKIRPKLLPHLFSLIMIIAPFVLIWVVSQSIDQYGHASIDIVSTLGKGGSLSGRELAYVFYFDLLRDQGGVLNTLIFGGGTQNLYILSYNDAYMDKYAYIYSASLQFILFFGLPITYWFFWKIGNFIVYLESGYEFKYAVMIFVIIVSNSYGVLSLMHFSLGFLILLLGVKTANSERIFSRSIA